MLNPVTGDGRFAESLPFFGGMKIWDANPKVVEKIREADALFHAEKFTHSYMHCWRHKTPVIYRATTQWFAGMDDVPGFAGRKPAQSLRSLALARHRGHGVLPAVGQVAPLQHDRQPARLDAVPAAPVGRADALLRAQGDRRAASAHRRDPRAGCEARGAGRHRGLAGSHRRGDARRRGRPRVREGTRHARRVVRLGQHAPDGDGRPGRPPHRRGLACGGYRVPRRPLPRRFRPAPRLVPLVAARVVHAERPAAVQGPADARLHRGRRRQEDVEVEGQRRRAAEGVRDAGRGGPALVGGRHRLLRAISRSPTRS